MQKRSLNGLAIVAVLTASIASYSSTVLGADAPAVEIQVLSNFTSDVARGKVLDELIKEFNAQHKGEYTVYRRRSPTGRPSSSKSDP